MAIVAQGGTITQELWDSITLGAADVEATLFTVPLGQAGKTLYDTNMRQGGQLPRGWNFNIMALSFHVVADTAVSLAVALSKVTYELHVSDKVWNEGLLLTLPSGGGVSFDSDGAIAATLATRFGTPVSNNLKQLSRAIPLKEAEGFRVDFRWPVAPTAVQLWFVLHGELQRGLN